MRLGRGYGDRNKMPSGVYIRTEKNHKKRNLSLPRNEKHWQWKGENATYRSKHIWVEDRLGKPHICEYCGNTELRHRQYHWANISGEYKRDLSDWMRLCAKCHKIYDLGRKILCAY